MANELSDHYDEPNIFNGDTVTVRSAELVIGGILNKQTEQDRDRLRID